MFLCQRELAGLSCRNKHPVTRPIICAVCPGFSVYPAASKAHSLSQAYMLCRSVVHRRRRQTLEGCYYNWYLPKETLHCHRVVLVVFSEGFVRNCLRQRKEGRKKGSHRKFSRETQLHIIPSNLGRPEPPTTLKKQTNTKQQQQTITKNHSQRSNL